MKMFAIALFAASVSAQENATPLITEQQDRFTKKPLLRYQPDTPAGAPITTLMHEVGSDSVVLLYIHLKPTMRFSAPCTTEGLADGKPFVFPIPGESDTQAMRQGFVESVTWVITLQMLRTLAASTSVEIRHCGHDLYIQPSITSGAAQMLQAIEARKP
jgi:hypothetical protein